MIESSIEVIYENIINFGMSFVYGVFDIMLEFE